MIGEQFYSGFLGLVRKYTHNFFLVFVRLFRSLNRINLFMHFTTLQRAVSASRIWFSTLKFD